MVRKGSIGRPAGGGAWTALVAACVTWSPCDLAAQEATSAADGRPPMAATLTDLSFLSGCWAGRMGALDMREQWSEAEAGAMLGTTRYFRDGDLADFEFGMFLETDGEVWLWPYPRGQRSEHGFPLVSKEGGYVFENLEHDFPVRIIYVRDGEDRLTPRIEGRDGAGPGWSLSRVACPG